MTSSLKTICRSKGRPTWASLLNGVSDRRPGRKARGAPWQALTLKAVQTKDQAMHFGLSLIVAGWLATFGGE
jgi:hypothetical protein